MNAINSIKIKKSVNTFTLYIEGIIFAIMKKKKRKAQYKNAMESLLIHTKNKTKNISVQKKEGIA
jgi:hypothetical protein